jgi:hypothetical protein
MNSYLMWNDESKIKMVGATGLEPATSCSQSTRATNCATPRHRCEISLVSKNNFGSQSMFWFESDLGKKNEPTIENEVGRCRRDR